MSDKLVLPPRPTRSVGHRHPAISPRRTSASEDEPQTWVLPSLPDRPSYTVKKQPYSISHRMVALCVIGAAVAAAGVGMLAWRSGGGASQALPTLDPAPTVTARVTAVVTAIAPAPKPTVHTITAPPRPAVTRTVQALSSPLPVQPTPSSHAPAPSSSPTGQHWLRATLSASGGSGTFTVRVLVDTDASTATVDLTISGTHSITKKLSGPVSSPKSFTVTLSPGPGTYRMQASVHNSSGSVTTRPTSLEV